MESHKTEAFAGELLLVINWGLNQNMNFLAGKRYIFLLVNCSVFISVPVLFTMHTLFSLIIHSQCAHDFCCGTACKLHTDFVFPKLTWQCVYSSVFVAILSGLKKTKPYCNPKLISCKEYFCCPLCSLEWCLRASVINWSYKRKWSRRWRWF